MKNYNTLLLSACLLLLFSLIASQYLGEPAVREFTTHLYNSEESNSDTAQWSWRPPPEGGCVPNVTLFTIEERFGKKKLSFGLQCDSIIGTVHLDQSAVETRLLYSLADKRHMDTVTVTYKRFIKTLTMKINDQDKVKVRLSGREYRFTPWKVTVFYHPLVCLQSLSFNKRNILTQTSYPSCPSDHYYQPDKGKIVKSTIFTGDLLNVTQVLVDYRGCSLALMSHLKYGLFASEDVALYLHDGESSNVTEYLWLDVDCDDFPSFLLILQLTVKRGTFSVDLRELDVKAWDTVIDSNYINVSHSSINSKATSLMKFVVKSEPKHGIFLSGNEILKLGDEFSQTDLKQGLVMYKVLDGTQSYRDNLELSISAKGAATSRVNFAITYSPAFNVKLLPLYVMEGESANLSQNIINVTYGVSSFASFTILDYPKHGKITETHSHSMVDGFTSQYLINRSLMYTHDGSETTYDVVTLRVRPAENDGAPEKNFTMNISVTLVNDNQPIRLTSPTIKVVAGMDTFLSSADISYTDADIHQDSSDITFERQGILCGDIIHFPTSTRMFKFTQSNVDSGELIFRHSQGFSSCNLVMWVSDGEHVSSDILLIEDAAHNFVINGTQRLEIERGETATLDDSILNILSNTRSPANEIFITVKRFPHHGDITLPSSSSSFTYQDIVDGRVGYSHHGTLSVSDTFSLRINVDGVVYSQVINVIIDTDPDLLKPVITHNFPVAGKVDELVAVNDRVLLVSHAEASPTEIHFQVPYQQTELLTPFVIRLSNGTISGEFFTQEDINQDRIFYRITRKSQPSTVLVSFRGVSTDLVFTPIIVANYIDVTTALNTLHIMEGGHLMIDESFIYPVNPVFKNEYLTFVITKPALHVALYSNSTEPKQHFLWHDLVAGFISVQHDGSEFLIDKLSCKVVYLQAESREQEVMFIVEPINDNPPTFNSTGELPTLVIWQGSADTPLTNRSLVIEDSDGDHTLDALKYLLTLQAPGRILRNGAPCEWFTQLDVNNNAIVYQHQPHIGTDWPEMTSIPMRITDGKFTQSATLHVTFLTRRLKIAYKEVLQVFPSLPFVITSDNLRIELPGYSNIVPNLQFRLTSGPSHGVLTEIDHVYGPSATEYLTYIPDLSDHLNRKLCNNVSHTISDKVMFTIKDKSWGGERDVTLHLNISYLNINLNFFSDFVTEWSVIVVRPYERLVLTESMIAAGKEFDNLLFRCESEVSFGFQIDPLPMFCMVEGLLSDKVIWWKDLRLSKYSLICFSDINLTSQLVLSFAIKQHDKLYVADNFNFTILIIMEGKDEETDILGSVDQKPNTDSRDRATIIEETNHETNLEEIDLDKVEQRKNIDKMKNVNNTNQGTYNGGDDQGTNTGDVDQGTNTGDVDQGTNTGDVDQGTNTGDVDQATNTGDVDQWTDIVTVSSKLGVLQGYSTAVLMMQLVPGFKFDTSENLVLELIAPPKHGELVFSDASNVTVLKFSAVDIVTGNILYKQSQWSKSDKFELFVKYIDRLSLAFHIIVTVYTQPNVVSTAPLVAEYGKPILITTRSLDASPLLELSQGEPTYYITRPPKFGSLSSRVTRRTRSISRSLTEFSHTDIVNELILYYPPDFVAEASEDNFTYTLSTDDIQPADGIFTVVFNESGKIGSPDQSVEITPSSEVELSKTALLIIVAVVCVFVFATVILAAVLCLRHSRNRKQKHKSKQESNTEPRLVLTKENGSYKLLVTGGDDFVFPPKLAAISPTRKIDPRKESEVSFSMPQVKVIPLMEKDGTEYNLHDYVNCEDLPCFSSSKNSQVDSSNSHSCSSWKQFDTADDSLIYQSIERMPTIKKPNYSC